MPPSCIYPGCAIKAKRFNPETFHDLPLRYNDPELLPQWLVVLKMDIMTPVKMLKKKRYQQNISASLELGVVRLLPYASLSARTFTSTGFSQITEVTSTVAAESRSHQELYSQSYDEVGVMFASIAGFNEYFEQKEIRHEGVDCLRLLNEIIASFDDLLEESYFHYVEKIKTIGSCYMAASGLAPNGQASMDEWNHLSELVLFALAMQETLKEINRLSAKNFQLRVGIAHGPLVAGVIGATKPQYDIWGSTVNLASRMDSTGVSGRIQVPEATRRVLAEWGFVLELRGEIFVKGVSESQGKVRTYFVSTMRSKRANVGRMAARTGGRMTLAGVVFGLVQSRQKEKMRETNGGFCPTPSTHQC